MPKNINQFRKPKHQRARTFGFNRGYLGMASESNLTGRAQFAPKTLEPWLRVGKLITHFSRKGNRPEKLRVLEIGAGSGRLANHLIKNFGIRPENYAIGDIDYAKKGKGPFLVKEIHQQVKNGKLQKFHLNALNPAPEGIGKFSIILMPNVLGTVGQLPGMLKQIVRNYGYCLEKGGFFAINRVFGSEMDLLAKDPALSKSFGFFTDREGAVIFIKKK